MKNLNLLDRSWCSLAAALVVLVFGGEPTLATDVFVTPITPGIYFSQSTAHRLSAEQKNNLIASLRRITGWPQLRVDESDRLILEQVPEFVGGSVWARRVISEVFRSGNRFVVESHANSGTVNFGQLDEGTNYFDPRTNIKLDIYCVRLDFDDFKQMEATPAVRDAFDEGFTLLHELLHGLGLHDTGVPDEIGDCEHLVNKMRADLGVPLRDQYLGETLMVTPWFKTVRLRFKSQDLKGKPTARGKKHYLFFVMNAVPEWEPRRSTKPSSTARKEKLLASFAE